MKTINYGRFGILFVGGVLAVILLLTLRQGNRQDEGYAHVLINERAEKDKFMRDNSQSPFKMNGVAYSGLTYYEPDINYRVMAQLEPIREKKVRVLPTSNGKENRYLEYAWTEFMLKEKKLKLLILESMEMGPQRGMLFCAFADSTSGRETYGAGRYLEVKKIKGATTLELDFNKAYNPYCAYVDSYSCPFPPRENILPVAIKAGERNYAP